MPSVVPRPSLSEERFVLRPPAPPAGRGGVYLPPLYTEEDLERARAEGEERGREAATAAFGEATAAAEAACRAQVESLRRAAASLANEERRILREAAEGVCELSFRIARAVLRREIQTSPEAVVPLLREMLQRAGEVPNATVRLSPRDYAAVTASLEAVPEASGMEGLRFRSDPRVEDGGCTVETEAGSLDARLETQLLRIEAALGKPAPEFHTRKGDGKERP